jgi:MOSC domain-containing protein YiiM
VKLLSIQVGRPREVVFEGRPVNTAIFKTPVSGPVRVGRLNLDGDAQADLKVHGGPDKAVYAYSVDAYPSWNKEMGTELGYGSLGENLSVDRLDEEDVCVGDIVAVGSCALLAVQPRLPCFKLGVRLGTQEALKAFMRINRPGIYFRVLEEGEIRAGDRLAIRERDPEKVPLSDLFRFHVTRMAERGWAERALRARGLTRSWREKIEKAVASA